MLFISEKENLVEQKSIIAIQIKQNLYISKILIVFDA